MSSHSQLKYGYSPQEIRSICENEINKLKSHLDSISKLSDQTCSFKSIVLEIEKRTTEFDNKINPIVFLKYVSPQPQVREAADYCENLVQQLFVEIFSREDLFKKLTAARDKKESLVQIESKLFEEYLILFKRNGLELSPEVRQRFIDKKKRLVSIESEFANRLVNEDNSFEVTSEQLKGLPQSYIDSLDKTPSGKFKLTMSYPHYYPCMQNAENSDLRKEYEFRFNNRGGDSNRLLLEEAISLRNELAQMLGYATHAEFVLERRMAKTPRQVREFLESLVQKLKPKAQAELKALQNEKSVNLKTDKSQINSWDWRYYENIIRKTQYSVDPQTIKEYFPLEIVIKGMFDIYQELLGVKFIEDTQAEVWHESVKKYKIEKNNSLVSFFYMDLFPREGKYGHAAAFTMLKGFENEKGEYQLPVSAIVANFSPPTPQNPSLLPHSEVETLFHEFGHIMHQTLTRAKYATFSGTSVKTDFVEAPSQMLENWVWNKKTLQKLSGHFSDPNRKLPDELVDKMIKAKLLNVGLNTLRQLAFGLIDLDYHSLDTVDSTEIYSKRMNEIMLIPIQDGTQPQASFGHLMGGYDSGYYGYMWSKVFAQDMFTRFESEGLLNTETGKDYLEWILKPGGEKEPMDLITGFLKREPSNEAFLKSLGL